MSSAALPAISRQPPGVVVRMVDTGKHNKHKMIVLCEPLQI